MGEMDVKRNRWDQRGGIERTKAGGGVDVLTIGQNRVDRVNLVFFKIKIHFISFLKKQTLQKKNLNRELEQ